MLSSSGARRESCKRGMGTRAGTGGAWGHGAVQGCDSPLQGRHPAAKAGCPKKLSSLIPSVLGSPQLSTREKPWHGAGRSPVGHPLQISPSVAPAGPRASSGSCRGELRSWAHRLGAA